MRARGLLVLVLLLSAIAAVSTPARAVGPTISNVTWTPWVPAHGENATVEADVVSPGGSPTVYAAWCVIPAYTCIPYEMSDPDGDGRFTSGPIRVADPPFTGAHFNVSAMDPTNVTTYTPDFYVQFASNITVNGTLSPRSVAPRGFVTISGTALYENNSSVPARFSAVDIEILGTGTQWRTSTDSEGGFASGFSAPAAVDSYTVRVTVSNRSISGSEDLYLSVERAPTPDLAEVPSTLTVNPSPANAGDTVTISVTVENRGTAPAGPFSVLINVSRATALAMSQPLSVQGLEPGARKDLSATWTAIAGTWTVTVIIDSAGQVSELNETNNRATATLDVAPNPQVWPAATLILGGAIVGVGVATAALFVYRRRAGRGKEP